MEAVLNSNNKNPSETPLHTAVRSGDIEMVQMLLRKGANIDAKNSSGETSLHVAVECKKMEIIGILLNEGASFEATTGRNETPLHLAAKAGLTEIIKLLLSKGANVNAEATDGVTSLHLILFQEHSHGHKQIVEPLLNYGANVNAVYNISGREESYTPLHFAAEYANKETMNLLLRKGANVNAEANDGVTALHLALYFGCEHLVVPLVNYGANVNAVYSKGREKGNTLLHAAVERDLDESIKLLLSKGANVNAEGDDGTTSLHIALLRKEFGIAKHLLNYGANVNAVYSDDSVKGYTPLHLAAKAGGREELINLLLSKGANVNAEANDGVTALHLALLYYGPYFHQQIVEPLINYGANVNAVYNTSGREEGYTPLHFAAEYGNKEIINLLLSKGANVNAEAKDGITPLHIALQRREFRIAKHLLNYGAEVNAVYNTPEREEAYKLLYLATYEGDREIINLLLSKGANVTAEADSKTSLHLAFITGCEKIDTALIEFSSETIRSKQNYKPLDLAMYFNDSFCNTYFSNRPLAKIHKRHMVKIKVLNLYAVNNDIPSISTPTFGGNDEELSDFQNECEKEIASMKSEVINDNITLYDILTKSVPALARYASNESIVEAFGSDNYKTKFPIYASMIQRSFKRGEKEKQFMEKADKVFGFLFSKNFPRLPPECTEKILSYLNYDDLINFIYILRGPSQRALNVCVRSHNHYSSWNRQEFNFMHVEFR